MIETALRPPSIVASVEKIREHFPALLRQHHGRPVAYFDGPGGTQVPRRVVDAMSDYLFHHNANTHWAYPTSHETDAMIEEARGVVADFLNAAPNEISFGANMTTLTFHLSRALGREYERGDEIVVTELDHHANVAPWHALAKERGVTIRTVKMIQETGQLDWEDFAGLVNGRTKLVALAAASNALGTINDLSRATGLARKVGAKVFVDAVHFAPHELLDVREIECDFLSCSAYKFYGPHIGVLFARKELLESLDFPKLIPSPDSAPERAETGTQNHEGIMGAAAAIDFLASLAEGETRRERLRDVFAELHRRSNALVAQLWDGLSRLKGVQLFGPALDAARTPTIAFTIDGIDATEACEFLGEQALFASNGDFYAATVVERLGRPPGGLIRAGCACYTTVDEVER
ncbi:MAG: cysteine desulfurase-like protein, partial [Acidobacteriota bacterium]|nr:cysteine desulfurase-like protein [Acidobacteriota bacterium]